MTNYKERHLFPGGNTSKGFYSFYRYILTQEDSRRIICLKGGPGTGKSSFMKKIGAHFGSLGYSIEYHHCSSDNESLDGVVIKELNVAVLDGTSPHIVDPINPGAVDEILNLGTALNTDMLYKNKLQILKLNKEISRNFKRAYRFLGSAKFIHDDWSSLNSHALNSYSLFSILSELKSKISAIPLKRLGKQRHMFGTAFTPNGIISYNKNLSSDLENLYILKGGPGLGKTFLLKSLGEFMESNGYFVEYLHDPFIPERLENIIIPQLSCGVFTTNEISNLNYDGIEYNMEDYCDKSKLSNHKPDIDLNKSLFTLLVNRGLSYIIKAHSLHDSLESYYISAMNFDAVNTLYEETIKKIEAFQSN